MSIINQKKNNISARIKTLRHTKNLSIADLHKNTGIPESSLNMYESSYKMPSLKALKKIADCFGVSLDFLLLWDKTKYPKNLKLLNLAEKIDKMAEIERFQIVTMSNTLMGKDNSQSQLSIKQDDPSFDLTGSFNSNLKTVREKRGIPQTKLANNTSSLQSSISGYEKNQTPPVQKLVVLAESLDISIHALTTGQKLCYSFKNGDLLEVILKADNLLPLDDKETIIKLMERMIQNEAK